MLIRAAVHSSGIRGHTIRIADVHRPVLKEHFHPTNDSYFELQRRLVRDRNSIYVVLNVGRMMLVELCRLESLFVELNNEHLRQCHAGE